MPPRYEKAPAPVGTRALQFYKKLVLDIRFITVRIDVVLPTTRSGLHVVTVNRRLGRHVRFVAVAIVVVVSTARPSVGVVRGAGWDRRMGIAADRRSRPTSNPVFCVAGARNH
jgi:hypothetical protein